jgi:hypothetical protein
MTPDPYTAHPETITLTFQGTGGGFVLMALVCLGLLIWAWRLARG